MQSPPSIELMLTAVNQVIYKIKNNQVNDKTHDGMIGDVWPQGINVQGWKTFYAQHAKDCFYGIFKGKKHDQLEQA